jgi:hypothetical protein
VMMVVVMMVTSGKSGRTGEHHQEKSYSENLFHGLHPSRLEFASEGRRRASYLKRNEAVEAGVSAIRGF